MQQLTALLEEFIALGNRHIAERGEDGNSALRLCQMDKRVDTRGESGSRGCGSGQPYSQRALVAQVFPGRRPFHSARRASPPASFRHSAHRRSAHLRSGTAGYPP
jgi:hypothetical protein